MTTENSGSVRQWLRVAQLVVGKGGNGLMIENLRIQFEVVKTVDSKPNKALIKVFNLNQTHDAQIRTEYTDVFLNAGYEGALNLVFRGNITHVFHYKEGTDWITEIEAADGDKDYRNAVVNEVLAAGATNQDVVDRVMRSMPNTSKGYAEASKAGRTRGKVLVGNARDHLDKIAKQDGANWSIQDGTLQIVKTDSLLPNEAIVVNSATGMLGAPEINEDGITVKFLMNPKATVNGALQLDNNNIQMKGTKIGETKKGNQQTGERVNSSNFQDGKYTRLDPDGIYKMLKVTHKGDTRGKDWQTEAVCVAIDGRATLKRSKKK